MSKQKKLLKLYDSVEFTEEAVSRVAQEIKDNYKTRNFQAINVDVAATFAGRRTKNNFIYLPDRMREGAHTFTYPYPKPVIINHDLDSEPIGRVAKAEFIDISNEYSQHCDYVRNFYLSHLSDSHKNQASLVRRMIKDGLMDSEGFRGLGFIKLSLNIPDKDAAEKFMDGRYFTVSTSATSDKAVCSSCLTDWLNDGAKCEHSPGEKDEDGFLVSLITDKMVYDHISPVNRPACDIANVIEVRTGEILDSFKCDFPIVFQDQTARDTFTIELTDKVISPKLSKAELRDQDSSRKHMEIGTSMVDGEEVEGGHWHYVEELDEKLNGMTSYDSGHRHEIVKGKVKETIVKAEGQEIMHGHKVRSITEYFDNNQNEDLIMDRETLIGKITDLAKNLNAKLAFELADQFIEANKEDKEINEEKLVDFIQESQLKLFEDNFFENLKNKLQDNAPSQEELSTLSKSQFAIRDKRFIPVSNEEYILAALDILDESDLSEEQTDVFYAAIYQRADALGVEFSAFKLEDDFKLSEEYEVEDAVLKSAQRTKLPDAAFAAIHDGKRMLPHHSASVKKGSENGTVDKSHLRNALARVNQIKAPSEVKAKARAHLERHARTLLPTSSAAKKKAQDSVANGENIMPKTVSSEEIKQILQDAQDQDLLNVRVVVDQLLIQRKLSAPSGCKTCEDNVQKLDVITQERDALKDRVTVLRQELADSYDETKLEKELVKNLQDRMKDVAVQLLKEKSSNEDNVEISDDAGLDDILNKINALNKNAQANGSNNEPEREGSVADPLEVTDNANSASKGNTAPQTGSNSVKLEDSQYEPDVKNLVDNFRDIEFKQGRTSAIQYWNSLKYSFSRIDKDLPAPAQKG